MLHLDIFIVLVLLGVYNLITEMRDYQHINKTRGQQSYKNRHDCDRHHMPRLQIQIKRKSKGSHPKNSKTTRQVVIAPVQSRNQHCLINMCVVLVWYWREKETDFVCLYTYEFWLSLCMIARSSVILLLPLSSSWVWSDSFWIDIALIPLVQ